MNSARLMKIGQICLFGMCFLFLQSLAFAKAELVFYLPFDEGKGEVTIDKVGGLEGNIVGAKWVEGKTGQGLYFDGKEKTECNYVGFPQTKTDTFFQFFDDKPFSITCWIKPDSTKSSKLQQEILNTGDDLGPGWRLFYFYDAIRFLSGRGAKPDVWNLKTNPACNKVIPDGWNHVAIVRDEKGIASLYLNGEKVDESEKEFKIIPYNKLPLSVGSYHKGYAYGFKGVIDEVKFYKGALTTEEIYQDAQREDKKKISF